MGRPSSLHRCAHGSHRCRRVLHPGSPQSWAQLANLCISTPMSPVTELLEHVRNHTRPELQRLAVTEMGWHTQGPSSSYSQVSRIGPDGLVVGPNSAGNVVSKSTADQPVVDLGGIKNVKLGPNGLQINPGSNLNSSVQVPSTSGLCSRMPCMQIA